MTRYITYVNKTNPTKEIHMKYKFVWHGEANNRFAFLDYHGESYTLTIVPNGINIYRDIEGNACIISQVDTEDEAIDFIMLYATQLIDC